MKQLLTIIIALSLTACGSLGGSKLPPDADYASYLAAREADAANHKQSIELVKIEAQPGQQISVSGLKSVSVSMPAPPAPGVQQKETRPSEWASVASTGLNVLGTVLGIKFTGQAAVGLANAVGNAATGSRANVTTTTTTTDSHPVTTTTDNHAVDNHAVAQPAAATK